MSCNLAGDDHRHLGSIGSEPQKKDAVDWDILRGWGPGIAVEAVTGVLAASALRTEHLQALFGLLGMVIGIYLGLGKSELRLGDAMPKGLCRAALSPSVGLLSVLMGIGGGSIGVPLMSLYNILIHGAVATAAGFGVIIAVPSVLGFLFFSIAPEHCPPLTVGAVNLVAFGIVVGVCAGYV